MNRKLKNEYQKIFKLIDKIIFLQFQVLKKFMNGDYYKRKTKATLKRKENYEQQGNKKIYNVL